MNDAPETYRARMELLEQFLEAIKRWDAAEYEHKEDMDALRSFINRRLVAARSAVEEAQCLRMFTVYPAPISGKPPARVDLFLSLFEDLHGTSPIPAVADMVERAIGVYEQLASGTGLIHLSRREAIDVEAAIERALRPSFKEPPNTEREVQDAIETILRAQGVEYRREQETAPVGPRKFIPDFTLTELALAIEVKLATSRHGPSKIQEEIAADITAYKTKWSRILFVVYDNGAIEDPYRLKEENMKLFGVSMIIVKH